MVTGHTWYAECSIGGGVGYPDVLFLAPGMSQLLRPVRTYDSRNISALDATSAGGELSICRSRLYSWICISPANVLVPRLLPLPLTTSTYHHIEQALSAPTTLPLALLDLRSKLRRLGVDRHGPDRPLELGSDRNGGDRVGP